MTRRITCGLAAAALAVAATIASAPPLSAQLFNNPFGRGSVGISEQDWMLMTNAMRGVLQEYRVGATREWRSPTSGRAGTWILMRTFQRDGMRCAQVTHEFTSGPGFDYTAPMCQVPDGSWMLAF